MQKRPRSTWQLFILSFSLIGITSCTIGRNITESDLANNPNGSDVTVTFMNNRNVTGELLTVDSTSVMVLIEKFGEGMVNPAPDTELPAVGKIWFSEAKIIRASHQSTRIVSNGRLDGSTYNDFAYLGRFPQGISPGLLSSLLEAYDQDEFLTFGDD